MNSHRRSYGKFFRNISLIGFGLLLSSCVTSFERSSPEDSAVSVTDEVSLQGDRAELEKLRKDIPPEIRRENDELAEILKLMGQVSEPPPRVREKYQRGLRKERDTFRKNKQKVRKDFRDSQKKDRDQFLKKLKEERNDFNSKKVSRDERQRFFSDQDTRRREFFANQKDRQNEFEADLRQKEKDFNFDMNEKQKRFELEYRDYSKRYQELKKQKEQEKRQEQEAKRAAQRGAVSPSQMRGSHQSGKATPNGGMTAEEAALFKKMSSVPATPLGADEE